MSIDGGLAAQVTSAPEGVVSYEWAPDGGGLAFIMREPARPTPVIRVDAPAPPVRLWVQPTDAPARPLTPPEHYVDSFSWAPDARSVVYSAAPIVGFMAPYSTRLYRIALTSNTPKVVIDRPGMNTSPQVSPDGKRVAFVTTSERVGLIAPRGLAVADVARQRRARTVSRNPILCDERRIDWRNGCGLRVASRSTCS